jgi:signal transduction histidine kinase
VHRPDEKRLRTQRALLAIGPAVVVLLFGALAYDGLRRINEVRERVGHSRDVIITAQHTLLALQDAETGQRGYLLTGEEKYLQSYELALATLSTDTAELRSLTRDNASQQARLDSLAPVLHDKLAELSETIELRKLKGLAASVEIMRGDRGQRDMDRIRAIVSEIVGHERALLAERRTAEENRRGLVTGVLIAGTIVGFGLALMLAWTLFRHIQREVNGAERFAEQHEELQQQATELELQAQMLQEQAAELEHQNTLLNEARIEADEGRRDAEVANRTKTQFLSIMSHELRTPLNAIAGHAQLMEMGVHGPVTEAQRESLERIRGSQTHLLYLINDLLNLSRIESGRVEYNLEDVVLGDVLQDMTPMVEPQFSAKSIEFEISVPDGCTVRADREKLQQILINLLGNAAKFTPRDGRVLVTCGTRAGSPPNNVYLRVRDSGPGIPRGKQESIFEPFVQLDRHDSQNAAGVGLGLAIARDLARGMGGDLRVRSEVGEGAVFTLTLLQGGIQIGGDESV